MRDRFGAHAAHTLASSRSERPFASSLSIPCSKRRPADYGTSRSSRRRTAFGARARGVARTRAGAQLDVQARESLARRQRDPSGQSRSLLPRHWSRRRAAHSWLGRSSIGGRAIWKRFLARRVARPHGATPRKIARAEVQVNGTYMTVDSRRKTFSRRRDSALTAWIAAGFGHCSTGHRR